MTQEQWALSALAVILRHMERAARIGDAKALKEHSLVYRAIINRVEKNT